jgi:hypothetical protein
MKNGRATPHGNVIVIKDLTKQFDEVTAVNGLNLKVRKSFLGFSPAWTRRSSVSGLRPFWTKPASRKLPNGGRKATAVG